MIYLDSNSTTALLPEVLDEMLPWLREGHANPSGAHASAKRARRAIEHAREQVAALIGAEPDEVHFNSGGTEGVNTALHSLCKLAAAGTAVVSSIEHSAVLRCVETLPREVTRVTVAADGRLEMDAFEKTLPHAAFVSLMLANNETGVIQPLKQAVLLAHARGIPVHTDAVQAVGKIPVNVKELGVDLISLSSHKFHGPKGVGALYVRRGLRFSPLLLGGGQESGRRSGTENTPGIVGMGAAAETMKARLGGPEVKRMRDLFEQRVVAGLTGVTPNGSPVERLPNTSHLSFDHCEAAGLLILLDEAGIACSAGSACMTGKQKPSHVQLAMGIPESRAKSSLRFSFSILNTEEEAVQAAGQVIKAVIKLRRVQGPGVGPVAVYSP